MLISPHEQEKLLIFMAAELALKKDRPAPEYREAIATCLKAALRMKEANNINTLKLIYGIPH